jgi:hypothetical protein
VEKEKDGMFLGGCLWELRGSLEEAKWRRSMSRRRGRGRGNEGILVDGGVKMICWCSVSGPSAVSFCLVNFPEKEEEEAAAAAEEEEEEEEEKSSVEAFKFCPESLNFQKNSNRKNVSNK